MPNRDTKTMRTFEDWWVMRTLDGTENKDLARDAWFAAQKVIIDFEFSVARAERLNAQQWDRVERRKDNWTLITQQYVPLIGTRWKDHRGECSFFGLVHADDDYYYGMMDKDGKVTLATCVGALESMYEAVS